MHRLDNAPRTLLFAAAVIVALLAFFALLGCSVSEQKNGRGSEDAEIRTPVGGLGGCSARGGAKRAKVLSRERRVAIAKAAIAARWQKAKRRTDNEKGKTKAPQGNPSP